MKTKHLSRRGFLKSAAAAAGAVTFGGLIPSTVLGANDRITFGMIGVGGMGTGHVNSLVGRSEDDNIRVVAISDCYKSRITRAVNICKKKN